MELVCERMCYGADAIAHREDGKTVFVEGAVAGDVVEAEVVRSGRSFDRARATKIVSPSPERVEAPCIYVDVCGGCPWAHLAYDAQRRAKRRNVVDALVRVGRFDAARAEELVAEVESPSAPWGYRNKVELHVAERDGRLRLGYVGASGEGIVAVDRCPLLPKRFERLPKRVAGALGYLARGRDLALSRVGIRASVRTGEVEVALWTAPAPFPRAMARKVIAEGVNPTGLVRVMVKDGARKLAGQEVLAGKERWSEVLDAHPMAVSAPSFFQVNTKGADALVALVVGAVGAPADLTVFDLYSGAGTFTLPLARRAAWVCAVESFGPAVRDLRHNVEAAGLENVEVTGGDAAREFPEGEADAIVVDPPRAGLSEAAVAALGAANAPKLVYVSCDPETLARDLARLEAAGHHRVLSVRPVDLFPETYHVECVVELNRKG